MPVSLQIQKNQIKLLPSMLIYEKEVKLKEVFAYVMVMVPLSGSGLMRISRSPASPSNEGSVTLKNLNLSKASLALLHHINRIKSLCLLQWEALPEQHDINRKENSDSFLRR
jgi:hypothetical protein